MGIILFLVDTSASMNQRTFLGTSYLDIAKGAIDTFMKYRSRDPASRGDRYMLVTFDEPPNAVKSGWKENHTTFVYELKNLQATGLSSFGQALKESFQLLNLHRLHNCIDHYGQGRNPFFLEPAVIIALTDSARLTNQITVEDELTLPMDSPAEGSELTKEPFRWDHRLFTVLLQLPGIGGVSSSSSSNGVELSLSNMSEATGGKCYLVTSQKTLVQAMESLSQKLHPGVVINFQKIGGSSPGSSVGPGSKDISRSNTPVTMEIDNVPLHLQRGVSRASDKETPPPCDGDPTAWYTTRKMIFVKPSTKNNVPTGFWPVPESFWPDSTLSKLPPRDVHPIVLFSTVDTPPLLVENFPFDKYELEPSLLTQMILSKKTPQLCWQKFVKDLHSSLGQREQFKASELYTSQHNTGVKSALIADAKAKFAVHLLELKGPFIVIMRAVEDSSMIASQIVWR